MKIQNTVSEDKETYCMSEQYISNSFNLRSANTESKIFIFKRHYLKDFSDSKH